VKIIKNIKIQKILKKKIHSYDWNWINNWVSQAKNEFGNFWTIIEGWDEETIE